MIRFRLISVLFLPLLAGVFWMYGFAVHGAEQTSRLQEIIQEGRNIYEVKPDGTGDFETIQEGVDSVESEDTLLIYPGIYEEQVVVKDKAVNLIGVDPKSCVLMANSDNYHNIPLTIAAGRVYGLTICGTSEAESPRNLEEMGNKTYDLADPESVYIWQDQYPGYAIHIDDAYSAGKTLSIEHCRIVSANNFCIGIGCWDSTEITITDCDVISRGNSGCIFVHNTNYPIKVGTAQVTIKDSQLRNYVGPYVMVVHSAGDCNPIAFTFQNVKVHTVAYENNECYNRTNINTWFQIDQLENPEVQLALRRDGYSSLSENSQLVYLRTVEQHKKFSKALEEQDSLLKELPDLAEGITYWESGEKDLSIVPEKARHSIDMKNADGESVGDGWCGLIGIYLTEDSSGNTLPEMNYPKPVTAAAAAE